MSYTRFRCLVLALLLSAGACAAGAWVLAVMPSVPTGDTEFAPALTWLLSWTGVVALGGLLVSGLRGVAEAWRGSPASTARGFRRWMVLACGVGLAPVLTGPALATPVSHPVPPLSVALTGLPMPERPVTPPERAIDADRVTVRPGDSLWRIAAVRLPHRSESRLIAAGVRRLHRLNREVIGPDPALLHPGQSLRVPRWHERSGS